MSVSLCFTELHLNVIVEILSCHLSHRGMNYCTFYTADSFLLQTLDCVLETSSFYDM